jgi:hypothetical protein
MRVDTQTYRVACTILNLSQFMFSTYKQNDISPCRYGHFMSLGQITGMEIHSCRKHFVWIWKLHFLCEIDVSCANCLPLPYLFLKMV